MKQEAGCVRLWKFRVAPLGIQRVLWTTLGLVFGAVAERKLSQPRARFNS